MDHFNNQQYKETCLIYTTCDFSMTTTTGFDLAANLSRRGQLVHISYVVPLDIGVPVYGFVVPIVVLTTLLTNSFVVFILSR
uniref:Uncharacterized protein n=1 Tax=Romanomermis culicivorax TaxID=13658 RepID=A0A915ISV8_ROMCU